MSVLQQGAAPPVGTGQKQLLGRRRAGASSTADTVTDDPDLGNAILEASRAEDPAVPHARGLCRNPVVATQLAGIFRVV